LEHQLLPHVNLGYFGQLPVLPVSHLGTVVSFLGGLFLWEIDFPFYLFDVGIAMLQLFPQELVPSLQSVLPWLLLQHLLCFLLLPAYELVRDFFLARLLHDDIESLGLLKAVYALVVAHPLAVGSLVLVLLQEF